MKIKPSDQTGAFRSCFAHFTVATILLFACGHTKIAETGAPVVQNADGGVVYKVRFHNDTTLFHKNSSGTDLLTLDEHGHLALNNGQIIISLKEGLSDGIYDLSVMISDSLVFNRTGIEGISKIFFDNEWLLFTIYTFFSEDGTNTGEAVLLNRNKLNPLQLLKRSLTKTCNPVFYLGKFYFIDELSIIETDVKLANPRTLPLVFYTEENKDRSLDTYLICGLSVNEEENLLQIEYTPTKSQTGCTTYEGTISKNDDVLLMKEY